MKIFIQSFMASVCVTVALLLLGYVDLYPRLQTEVALYDHTSIEGETVLEPGNAVMQSLYAYTTFDQISIILTQNSNPEELQVWVCDSENNILSELDAEEYFVEKINETEVMVKFSVNEHQESLESGKYHITFKNRGGRNYI